MPVSQRISEFDTWRPGYPNSTVTVRVAGTTTLAAVFYDPELTLPAPNPITLDDRTVDGIEYGRFPQALYVGTPYQLLVDGAEFTGVQALALSSLAGVDASDAVVTAIRGSASRSLDAWLNDTIHVLSWGALGANATTNTGIITAAVGAAAAQGGGEVHLPPGVWDVNTLSIPSGVVLRGDERAATTLRSTQAEAVVTLAGNRSGLRSLTLDGINLLPGSIGVYTVGLTGIILEGVLLKRFETGIETRGFTQPSILDFSIDNCTRGAAILADTDAGGSGAGSGTALVRWQGGAITNCTEYGVRLAVVDAVLLGVEFSHVQWSTNVGPALKVEGALAVTAHTCRFSGNTAALAIMDGTDDDESPTKLLKITDTRFFAGTLTFEGACDGVMFERCEFINVDFVLSAPTGMIQLLDCVEDVMTSSTGNTEKLGRNSSFKVTEAFGVTTDATVTTAWSMEMVPGEIVRAITRIVAKQRNGPGSASYELCVVAGLPSSTVTYDLASAALTAGSVMTGATSGATALMVIDTPSGSTGTITVRNIVGDFVYGETVNFNTGQTARLTGSLLPGTALLMSAVESRAPVVESDAAWNATFDVTATALRLRVTGEAAKTIEWSCELDVFRA